MKAYPADAVQQRIVDLLDGQTPDSGLERRVSSEGLPWWDDGAHNVPDSLTCYALIKIISERRVNHG